MNRLVATESWLARHGGHLVLLLAVLVPWFGYGAFPLFDLDEGAFTASTTEMFLRGDFLSTWLNGMPRYDKPVLAYWLQAASATLFGFDEWGFRLPSVLAASAWIGITYAFTKRMAGHIAGVLAATMVSTSLGPMLIAKAATADALLNLCLAGAGYAAWLWLETRERRWLLLAWAAMAAGFLTKGPVAVVVPGGAVLLFLALERDWRAIRGFFMDARAWAIFLVIAAPWFILLSWRDGPGFLAGFFFKHNLGRFSAPMEGHGGSMFYYLPVLLLTLLPFTGLLFGLGRRLVEAWRTPWLRFSLIWFLLVFVIFSASGTKLPHYLYYGYGGLIPALAWTALRTRRPGVMLLPALAAGLILLLLPDIIEHYSAHLQNDHGDALALLDASFGPSYHIVFGIALAAILGLLATSFSAAQSLATPYRLGIAGLLLASAVSFALLPAAGKLLQSQVRAAGHAARTLPGPLVMIGVNTPSFQTYAGRRVERRSPHSGDLVLTRTRMLEALPARGETWIFGGMALVRIR